MSTRQDEDIRIYELPEAQELTAGMKVAVDSETDGTKSFDLSNLAGKVDEPETAPEAGQVLTFDGTENTWANPPEGVYVINYSEVTDLRDIDVDRIKTQPTFLKIDTVEPILIPITNSSGPYTVGIQPGTIMCVDEIGSDGTVDESIYHYSYNGPRYVVFTTGNGSSTGGGIIQNAVLKITCIVSLSPFGGVSKTIGINGFLNNNGGLFNSMPTPTTFQCFSGRGTGTINVENKDRNALQINIMSGSNIRSHCLLPLDIQNHDFSTDTTPEQIQFMGWGATSNRAGYRTISEVPSSTAQDEGKVLTVDSNGAAAWSRIGSSTSDLVLVTGSTGAEKAANCQAIIDAGKIPIYNFPIINNYIGQAINRILIYEYSDDSYFYFTGIYPNYFDSQFRADDADILFPFFHFSKTTFGHGYTERTLGDLPISTIPISSDSNSITIKNNRLIVISTSYTDGKSAYTVKISSHGFATNAVFEINPSVNMTLSVEKIDVTGTSTPLKYSVAAGNTLEAGKYYQVTAVGNCWTLAEFEA